VKFHSDEANEEAILFANRAYRTLHNRIAPARKRLAVSPLSWLLSLPSTVEIFCSSISQRAICTEVAATCINYTDFETPTGATLLLLPVSPGTAQHPQAR